MKSWDEEVEDAWIGDEGFVSALDLWVRRQLSQHRKPAREESVAPWTVNVLAADVIHFGRERRWGWATAAITMLGELIFCAEAGRIFPAHRIGFRDDLERNVIALRELRNAALHPAFQRDDGGKPAPMKRVVALLNADDDARVREAAGRLKDDWAEFATRPLTSYALRILDSAGRIFTDEAPEVLAGSPVRAVPAAFRRTRRAKRR